jgi:hypothetical protein
MERLIASYQEKLDSVTSNYQVNFLKSLLKSDIVEKIDPGSALGVT